MTEYDYSPEARKCHDRKQRDIFGWLQNTQQGPLRNPFTPATPAVDTYPLEKSEYPSGDLRTHKRGVSYDPYDPYNRGLDRDSLGRERGGRGRDRSLPHTSRPHHTSRHKQTATLQTLPPPLPLPPYLWQMPYSQEPSAMAQYYPIKVTSPRDSKRSSQSSSTTRLPSPNSYFPPQPSPQYPADYRLGYTPPAARVPDFTVSLSSSCSQSNFHCPPQNAPQYPHSAYQVKRLTFFKRLIRILTGGNNQAPQRVPRRNRSSSF